MASADLLQSLGFEFGFVAIARVGQTIRVEQQGIAGFQLQCQVIIVDFRK
jgi:hypothetical protein